jgi:hypothetical protein
MRICSFVCSVFVVLCVTATSRAQVTTSVRTWTHQTAINVTSATDYNGNDDTAGEQLNDWVMEGSGFAVRGGYGFANVVNAFLEFGSSPLTLVMTDTNDALAEYSFGEGLYCGVGVDAGKPMRGGMFWRAGLKLGWFNSEYDAVAGGETRTYAYDESSVSVEAFIGRDLAPAAVYGGVRYAVLDARLQIDRPSRPEPYTWDFERAQSADLVLGARTSLWRSGGFFEFSFGGSSAATAGVDIRF